MLLTQSEPVIPSLQRWRLDICSIGISTKSTSTLTGWLHSLRHGQAQLRICPQNSARHSPHLLPIYESKATYLRRDPGYLNQRKFRRGRCGHLPRTVSPAISFHAREELDE